MRRGQLQIPYISEFTVPHSEGQLNRTSELTTVSGTPRLIKAMDIQLGLHAYKEKVCRKMGFLQEWTMLVFSLFPGPLSGTRPT